MVGKVISGSSFSGTVGYVMKEESRILEAEGIMPPEVKDMVCKNHRPYNKSL